MDLDGKTEPLSKPQQFVWLVGGTQYHNWVHRLIDFLTFLKEEVLLCGR